MSSLQYNVVHRIPGRIRVRLPRLRGDSVFQERLLGILNSQTGVRLVRIAAECASITIIFDEKKFSPESSLDKLNENSVMLSDLPVGKDVRKRLRKNRLYRFASLLEAPPAAQLALGIASLASVLLPVPSLITRLLLLSSSLPIFGRGIRTVLEEGRPAVEFMDGASVVLLTVESANLPASIMLLLIGISEYIRDYAAQRSERMLNELLSLSRSSAWLVRNETRVRVPVEKINVGDALVVYTGERVPVDSIIKRGQATVIKYGSTADALPHELGPGDEVAADSVLLEGKLYINCKTARTQPVMDRIMERERRHLLYRTSYQKNALKAGYSIVAPILFFAAGAFLLSRNLNQALTIICFDFVTGIRIALPTAILSFIYKAGREGVLIKTGAALEQLSKIDVIIFARTGVITAGESEVTELIPFTNKNPDELLAAAAAVEYRYHHPAARAIYRYAKRKNIKIEERKNSQLYAGLGVTAELGQRRVIVGSRRLMRQFNINVEAAQAAADYVKTRGDSAAFIAFDNELVGLIAYRDAVRTEAATALQRLKEKGVREIIMTSGDAGDPVERIAKSIGIERVFSQLSPEEKADLVRDFQLRGQKVALVGDDVSDALAMAQADLSIAMNDSTDVARYRADIIITDDDLNHLPDTVAMSKQAMNYLRQNMVVVSLPNWLGLMLSITNVIGPVRGTILNNGSVIVAALNGLRPALSHEPAIEYHPLNINHEQDDQSGSV